MRSCPFCGDSRKLTAEHVWPRWLRAFPAYSLLRQQSADRPRAISDRLSVSVDPDGRFHFPKIGSEQEILLPDVTVKVCGPCNNGWMASLENEAKPIVTALINGDSLSLDAASVHVLARWVAKTSMAYSLRLPEHHHCFDGAMVDAVREGALPANFRVWVARSDSPHAQVAMSYFPALLTRGPAAADQILGRANVAASYIAAHGVVFIAHWTTDATVPLDLFDVADLWKGFAQLWPDGGPVRLPSRLLIEPELLSAVFRMRNVMDGIKYPVEGLNEAEMREVFQSNQVRRRRWRRRLRPLTPVLQSIDRALIGLASRRVKRLESPSRPLVPSPSQDEH